MNAIVQSPLTNVKYSNEILRWQSFNIRGLENEEKESDEYPPFESDLFVSVSRTFAPASGALTPEVEVVLRTIQAQDVKVPCFAKVMDYLTSYPDILDILLDACISTREKFPSPTQLSLEVFQDPESDDEYLTLYVRQRKYEENIFDRIEEVSEKYYALLEGARGWFIINTDLASP